MKLIFFYSLLLLSIHSKAQNVSSPYSILGIGDIETKDYGKYAGMGSTSIALNNNGYVNLSNPASLTKLDYKITVMDLYMRGRSSRFSLPGSDTPASPNASKDFIVGRVSLAFKVAQKWGFTFGLKPYSSVNYAMSKTDKSLGGTDGIYKSVDGSGGLNQVYFANGFSLLKNLSVGVTASYLFGSSIRNTNYYSSDYNLNINKYEYDVMRTFQFLVGIQYAYEQSPSVTHQIGLTIANPSTIHTQNITEYTEGTDTLTKEADDTKGYTLPLQFGAGYALVLNKNLTISADYLFSNWKKQKLTSSNESIDRSNRFSAGIEYSKKQKNFDKYFLQAGFLYENSYIHINNKQLTTIAGTAGLGLNLSQKISCYLSLEAGTKGNLSDNQIREKYTQFNLGFTMRDLWFNFFKHAR